MEELRTVVEDDVLISRAQSGDEQAFVDLVRAYHAFVYAVVIGIVNNSHDAEDVVQEVFINAYRGLSQLEDTTKFKSWLAEVGRNCARNWLRKQRFDTVPIDAVSADTLQTAESPDTQLIRDEQIELIRHAMKTLPRRDQEIAQAYYLEGASYDELTRMHGLSYKAISFRLSRAKRTLTKRLQYLLNVVFVPPVISLKKISSGGLTAMKIGTVPKITTGVITIIVIVFIGSHQLLSPKDGPSSSIKATVSTTSEPEQSDADIETSLERVVTAPKRVNQPQISAEEMEQIEDFFTQLEAADAKSETEQLTEVESKQDADGRVAAKADALTENTEQSAEEVMNAYLEALRDLDIDGMRSVMVGNARENLEAYVPMLSGELPEEILSLFDDMPEEVVELMLPMMREMMPKMLKQMLSQAEIVSSEYVGDEYHFRVRIPPPEVPVPDGFEIPEMLVIPDSVLKMRKEDGKWRIYE
ncbi:MAG: sigma-70 family RNA polymerase sigma factor [Candidatus Poribacteria bacterium]|nr:sigma-70 family RNA polymerase sigma factor [Candidatus Poribacteria bacterium]